MLLVITILLGGLLKVLAPVLPMLPTLPILPLLSMLAMLLLLLVLESSMGVAPMNDILFHEAVLGKASESIGKSVTSVGT